MSSLGSPGSPGSPNYFKAIDTMEIGDVVELPSNILGVVRYVGPKFDVESNPDFGEYIIGLELYEPRGVCNGTFEGHQYFCASLGNKYAVFYNIAEFVSIHKRRTPSQLLKALTSVWRKKREMRKKYVSSQKKYQRYIARQHKKTLDLDECIQELVREKEQWKEDCKRIRRENEKLQEWLSKQHSDIFQEWCHENITTSEYNNHKYYPTPNDLPPSKDSVAESFAELSLDERRRAPLSYSRDDSCTPPPETVHRQISQSSSPRRAPVVLRKKHDINFAREQPTVPQLPLNSSRSVSPSPSHSPTPSNSPTPSYSPHSTERQFFMYTARTIQTRNKILQTANQEYQRGQRN